MTPRHVPDDGSRGARLVLIGEAPGGHENRLGRPFVGPSGQLVAAWWRDVGLQRSDFYITNVYPYQPPANRIEAIPLDVLQPHVDDLHDRLAALDDPWLIVPTGSTALRALLQKPLRKRVRGEPAVNITSYRGSILAYQDRRGRTIKVIPTIHPAAIFKTPYWERRCRLDWKRIASDAEFRDLRLPEREHFIRPTLRDINDYVDATLREARALSLDIETPRERFVEPVRRTLKSGAVKTTFRRRLGAPRVTCIAFAYDANFSITIPTTLDYWKDREALDSAWAAIRALCAAPISKVTQNGFFDAWWLARDHACPLRAWHYDCLAMHHALDGTDDHDLAYQASTETRQPYWKDEAKDPDKIMQYATDIDALWTYNGIDACVQHELADLHAVRLVDEGAERFYRDHYRALFGPVLEMMLNGIGADNQRRRVRAAQLLADAIRLQRRLTAAAGEPLYGPKGSLAPQRLARFLYETLGLPKQYSRGDRGVDRKRQPTTKEVVVRKLMIRYPQKLREAGQVILDLRRLQKVAESYSDTIPDDDGRIYTAFSFSPETGRFSSTKAPNRRGRNLQNTDRETRCQYRPDDGCLFLEADESQAEDRIVKVYAAAWCDNPRRRAALLERARAMPWENDEHKRAAVVLFHTTTDAVTGPQRYLAKRTRHGANYDIHGEKQAEELLKDGYVFTADECQRMIDAIHAADPEVKEAYHRRTRQLIMRNHMLANTWGRVLDLRYERLNDDTYRRGYAFWAQSEVPAIVNQYGLRPLVALIRGQQLRTRVHLQGHDSLLLSTPPDESWAIASFLRESLERRRVYAGQTLTIPVEFKIGLRWKCECSACKDRPGDVVEFKRFPERDEWEAAVEKLV